MPICRLLLCISLCLSLTFSILPQDVFASGGGESKKEKTTEQKNKKKETATVTGGQFDGDPIYLHMAPVTLPVINDYGAQQIVTLMIDLEITTLDAGYAMQKQMPRLKDAVMQALYGGLADGSMRNAHALDIPKIKAAIHETLNKNFDGNAIKEVFIIAASQRKL